MPDMAPLRDLLVEDDGLACPEVGSWSELKYKLLGLYDELFSSGMKDKWGQRVYIDLYAAAGHNKIRGTQRRVMGSPLLALTVKHPFDRYIFCEEKSSLLQALKERCGRIAPSADLRYIDGSCDDRIGDICKEIPRGTRGNTVLSLCLVDPFDFGMKFETIRRLSDFFMDFLVLLAVGMDAQRNYDHYIDEKSSKIDEALGNKEWRERWRSSGNQLKFRHFLAREFALSMESLGYLKQDLHQMKEVRSDEKNLPLYYIALFSKHERGYDFWEKVKKSSDPQGRLFE
jgi:three-Cys-motif partner protein